MKHLSRLLFFLLLVAPAAFAQGYIHGNGDPRVTGVDCGRSRFYIDDTTSVMYVAGPGSPCVWTPAGSGAYPGVAADGSNGLAVSGTVAAGTMVPGPKTIGAGAAQLPAASACVACIVIISDGASASDTTNGGGTHMVPAWSDGVKWEAFGSGSGSGVTTPTYLSGLQLSLALDEGSGTSAADTSVNAFTGTWTGTQSCASSYFDTGIVGAKAGCFNGTNDAVSLAANSNLSFEYTVPLTMAAWIKTTATGAQIIFAKELNSGAFTGYNLLLQSGCELAATEFGSSSPHHGLTVQSSEPLCDGNWHWVVATFDGTGTLAGAHLYTDGYEVPYNTSAQDNTLGGTTIINTAVAQVGSRSTSAPFNGDIDNMQVWTRALALSEIQSAYTAAVLNSSKYTRQLDSTWIVATNITNDQQASCFDALPTISGGAATITTTYLAGGYSCVSVPSDTVKTLTYKGSVLYSPVLFQYGRFEIQATTPVVDQLQYYAFWLLGSQCLPNPLAHFASAPACGYGANFESNGYQEIDVMERGISGTPNFQQNAYVQHAAQHFTTTVANPGISHTWGTVWTSTSVSFTFDGTTTGTYNTTLMAGPMFMWINSYANTGATSSNYPQTMTITSVKHWTPGGVLDFSWVPGSGCTGSACPTL